MTPNRCQNKATRPRGPERHPWQECQNLSEQLRAPYRISAVLLQTVQEATRIRQPKGRHLKVIVVFLEEQNEKHVRAFFNGGSWHSKPKWLGVSPSRS